MWTWWFRRRGDEPATRYAYGGLGNRRTRASNVTAEAGLLRPACFPSRWHGCTIKGWLRTRSTSVNASWLHDWLVTLFVTSPSASASAHRRSGDWSAGIGEPVP